MIAGILYVLGVLDAALSAIRESGGRSAILDKRRYYWRSVAQGLVIGHVALGLSALVVLVVIATSGDRAGLVGDLARGGWRLLDVYVPYSVIILTGFAVRVIPSVDIRSLLSVTVFGPLTLIRPAVAVVGVAWAFAHVPRWESLLVGGFTCTAMLSVEHAIGWWQRKRPDPATSIGWR